MGPTIPRLAPTPRAVGWPSRGKASENRCYAALKRLIDPSSEAESFSELHREEPVKKRCQDARRGQRILLADERHTGRHRRRERRRSGMYAFLGPFRVGIVDQPIALGMSLRERTVGTGLTGQRTDRIGRARRTR